MQEPNYWMYVIGILLWVSRLLRREHLRRDLFIYLDSQQK